MVTGDVPCARLCPELGVYLLGAIEPAQRAMVDRHLASCRNCRTELSALAGLPSLLRRVPADLVHRLLADAVPVTPEPSLTALLTRTTAIRRRNRLLAVAAAVVTGIATASAVQAIHDASARPPAAIASAQAVTVQAANPVTGTWAAILYSAQPWGTELQVSVTGVAAGTRCQLLVTGQSGRVISAGGWDFAVTKQPAWYPASVPIQAARLRRFAIVADGKALVTIQAR
jgi:Putative zinc-finger